MSPLRVSASNKEMKIVVEGLSDNEWWFIGFRESEVKLLRRSQRAIDFSGFKQVFSARSEFVREGETNDQESGRRTVKVCALSSAGDYGDVESKAVDGDKMASITSKNGPYTLIAESLPREPKTKSE